MQILIPPGQKKLRIDKYLSLHVENSSRTKIKNSIDEGNVLVNGKIIKSNYEVQPNDLIDISLPEVEEKPDVVAEDLNLNIMFEDEYLIIVNKPPGMVTHPAHKNYSGTLVNGLMHYIAQKNEKLSEERGSDRAGIVHRLDKDTSGILVVAKDEETHRRLSELFKVHDIEREYWAVVWGRFDKKKGKIDKPLARARNDRKKVVVDEDGKQAITEYEVIKEFDFLSLIKLKLHTGRTHQIRVHMHSIGHPVFGDPDYQGRKPHGVHLTNKNKELIANLLDSFDRQALHAKVLGFAHPMTKKKVRFESELPEDIQTLVDKISVK